MAVFATGNFVAADGTALSVADPNFTVSSGAAVVQSNRVMTDATGTTLARHSGVPASANYAVTGDLYRSTSGAGDLGVIGRAAAAIATFYIARYSTGSGVWNLFRYVNGSPTQLGVTVAESFTAGQTKNVKLEMVGSSIRLYADGAATPTIQATDSIITAAGQSGMRCSSANSIHLASFQAYDPFSAFLAYRTAQTSSNMRKNQANQVVPFVLITSTGSAVTTGTTTVYVTGDNGTQTAGLGTVAHKGNGQWNYVPTKEETDFNHVDFLPVNALAVPCPPISYDTISYDPHDTVRLGLTALPNAAAGASGGLPLAVDSSGRVDVIKINGTSQTAGDIYSAVNTRLPAALVSGRIDASVGAYQTGLTPPTVIEIRQEIDTNSTQLAAIKAKTDNLPASPAAVSDIPTASAIASATWSATLTESYAADGAAFTGAQALYMLWAMQAEKAISSTTLTAKKLDGSTAAMTFTLDSATAPASITRAT